MKKNYLFIIALFALSVASITACKNKPDAPKETETEEADANKAPYTLELEEVNSSFAPALQSFAWANVGSKLLLVGGRTNGFHNFSGISEVFTPKRSNTYFYVVDLDSAKTDSMPIPAAYYNQLRSTNMESYHEGNTLYCIGGYGTNSNVDSPQASTYETYPYLLTIDVPSAMSAITSHNATALANSIKRSDANENLRVTGGELHKIGDWFYLVFGQNFNTIYTGNNTGIYTNSVSRFKIDNSGAKPMITNYAKDSCEVGDTNYHRRDLVVLQSHDINGKPNITVYGGVFTPVANLDYQTPIYISQTDASTGAIAITTDNTFLQMFNQYAAPNVHFFDPVNKVNYTSIIGGITQYYYDNSGTLINSNNTQAPMPWSNYITTIVRKADGSSVEYPQQTSTLPAYIGGEAIFVPHYSLAIHDGTQKVIDMSKIQEQAKANAETAGFRIMLGYMYGGIHSDAAQSSTNQSTQASNRIYKVYMKF